MGAMSTVIILSFVREILIWRLGRGIAGRTIIRGLRSGLGLLGEWDGNSFAVILHEPLKAVSDKRSGSRTGSTGIDTAVGVTSLMYAAN